LLRWQPDVLDRRPHRAEVDLTVLFVYLLIAASELVIRSKTPDDCLKIKMWGCPSSSWPLLLQCPAQH
jgi:hypothetical protein